MAAERGKKEITEHIRYGMLLSMIGGIMDAYSYGVRGGVFATGQTGNFVLFALGIARHDLPRALRSLVPIVSFWCGIFAAEHLLHFFFGSYEEGKRLIKWKRVVLFAEAILMLLVGFIPDSVLDIIPNTIISFSAAMQFCCFRKFGDDAAYASVFCTGNMRSCAEKYYLGLVLKDKKSLRQAFEYTRILAAFLFGAVLTLAVSPVAGERTIWIGTLCLVIGSFASYITKK